jgi:predicted dehydrogenase
MNLRGSILGCGMIAEFHLRGWVRIPEVEIVALCDRNLTRAEQRRDEYVPAARIYEDRDAMLAQEELDFIDILTPPSSHAPDCMAASHAGLHIICQKPLCYSLDEARDLVALTSNRPRVFAVHENHRYRPWFQRVRADLIAGAFGRVSLVQIAQMDATEPAEAFKNEAASGVWLEYGSHLVDLMRNLLGEPRRVYARMQRMNPRVAGESVAHAVYEYAEATAVIEAGWKHSAIAQAGLLVAGSSGEAWYEGTLTRGRSGRLRISSCDCVISDEYLSPYGQYVESFYLFERECVDAMLGRGVIRQTGEEHLRSLTCTFAAYDSARGGAVVEIS